jgi:hypothetical protein
MGRSGDGGLIQLKATIALPAPRTAEVEATQATLSSREPAFAAGWNGAWIVVDSSR